MSSSGGFDVGNIALNIKRKLQSHAGSEGIEVEASKRPKIQNFDSAGEIAEDPTEDLDEADLEALASELPDEDDMDAILKLVDEAPEVERLDAAGLRVLVLKFEKAVNTNVQMRSKYPEKPEKFMDSEIALDESITAMLPVSASPELYGELVKLNVVQSLLSLVSHENSDIAISVVNLLHDLLDSDELTGADEETAAALLESLMENNGVQVLAMNLFRMKESNTVDFQAVHNTLEIFEALGEVKPEFLKTLAMNPKILKFLCQRIAREGFDQNKLYASEILSVLLQNGDDEVKKRVGEGSSSHLIAILKVIAKFRRRDPTGPEETEFLENLYSSVCFALHDSLENQARFAKAEGLELMIAILRKKKYAKHGAIKTIDFALQGCQPNCEKFVDQGGLKVLFAIFMKRAKKKDKLFEKTTEEHVVSVIQQLFLNLSDVRYFRLLKKFQENNMQKIERLVELEEIYARRVEDAHAQYRRNHPLHERKQKMEKEEEDLLKEEEYMRTAEAGLFTLQSVDLLIGFVVTSGERRLKDRTMQLLNQQDSDLGRVMKVLNAFAEQVGEGEEGKNQKLKGAVQMIAKMLEDIE